MVDNVKFGDLLGKYRERCGWSQEELAKKTGVSRNAIALWEGKGRGRQSNTHPQSRGVVLRLADELQLSKEERKGFLEAAGFSIEHWRTDYWNVPYQHNPYFVGRDAILQSLRQRLVPDEKATALTQSISGLGGIGKTQVAIEYAHRYGEQYEAVFWIQADSQEVAIAAYLRLATEVLGLPEQQEANQQIAEVKHWLQKRHGWLLIFDNVEDTQAILSTFVPSKHQGSVLITTRMREAGPLACSEVLPLLSDDEGVLFLLHRAKRIALHASVKDATTANVLLAKELCQLMNGLPLALDQAGAYIAENGCSLQQYHDLYDQSRPKLLDRRGLGDHSDSVLMTFWLSWEQIHERNALAEKVLQFCAFLAPDQIPEPFVQAGISMPGSEKTPEELEMDEALGLLHRYSLVDRTEHMLSLHRLVQEVIQEMLSEEERQQWMQQAVRVVNMASPDVKDTKQWDVCEHWLLHALACARWIEEKHFTNLDAAHLLNQAAVYLEDRVRYSEAERLYLQALTITQQQLGINHSKVIPHLNNLASLYWHQGRYSEAEFLLTQTLTIHKQQVEVDHFSVALILNNLANIYTDQGKYTEAEQLYQQAQAINERLFGINHPEVATTLGNLAGLYRMQGKYTEAKLLYQQVLVIKEQLLGKDHPSVAINLNNLANIYTDQGKYTEAEQIYQQALAINERLFGINHPEVATTLGNLATLYERQGKYTKAESLFRHAFEINEQLLGSNHPHTAMLLSKLADMHDVQGKYTEVEQLYLQTLAVFDQKLGPDHPHTAVSLGKLANLYRRQRKYQEAESFYKQIVEIYEQKVGLEHHYTATSLDNLAGVYKDQGKYTEALPLYKRALEIYEQQLGIEHPHIAVTLNNLANLYNAQGKYAEAEPLCCRALAICEQQLGVEHPDTASILDTLAYAYNAQRKYSEAEPLLQRALTIRKEQLGVEHPDTARSLNYLGLLYDHQGKYSEAESLLQQALSISHVSLGMEDPQTQQILMNYLTLLSHMYTNGDMDALLQLLAKQEQSGNEDRDISQE